MTAAKKFASTGDMAEKKISFTEIGKGLYAFTAEGDPNTGVIIGDDSVMVIDAQATPKMAQKVIECVKSVTDKPIRYVLLSHYHAVRVLGASAYNANEIIASEGTYDLINERGLQDWDSEAGRFPRLFQGAETIPGLTWPTITFKEKMSLFMGKRRVDIMFLGRGHTAGDTVAYVPDANVIFTGDLVEYHSACYCGDAHYKDWPKTLDKVAKFNAASLVPGRGAALIGEQKVKEAISLTRDFLNTLYGSVEQSVKKGYDLKQAFDECRKAMQPKFGAYAIFEHCQPFNVARAYDEAKGLDHPKIWTAEIDTEMWHALQS
jgi:glyoxylase-like metal-dependent hydrolase (beta-lactamase superfamily II)